MVNRWIAGIEVPAGTVLWTAQHLKEQSPNQPELWTLPIRDDPTVTVIKRWWDGEIVYVARRNIPRGEVFSIDEKDQKLVENKTECENRTAELQVKLASDVLKTWQTRRADSMEESSRQADAMEESSGIADGGRGMAKLPEVRPALSEGVQEEGLACQWEGVRQEGIEWQWEGVLQEGPELEP